MSIEGNREEVADHINNIFKTRFNIKPENITKDSAKENLLGRKFQFTPRDLIYLFFEIEKEFDIRIPQDAICNGGFRTIEKIIDTVTENIPTLSE